MRCRLEAVFAIAVFCLVTCLLGPASAEIFFDDFNRPDGPLGEPWFLLNSYLYIETYRVVANSDEFGNMGYRAGDVYLEASIEADTNFNDDQGDGLFHLYTGGGEDEQEAWGYGGVVGAT